MAALIGVSLALFIGIMATWTGLDRGRSFYPTVMIFIAALYVLFALIGGPSAPLLAECAVMGAFVVASLTGFKKTLWLVVAALAAHGVYDLVHPHVLSNPGVPVWYPEFCSAYDAVAALYLAALLMRPVVSAAWERRLTAASSSGKGRASGSSALLPGSATRTRTSILTTSSS